MPGVYGRGRAGAGPHRGGTEKACPGPPELAWWRRRGSRAREEARLPMAYRPLSAVVLAAGEGTRMQSERPKPLHLLCGRPMVLHVLDALAELDVDRVVVVVGHRGEWVTKTLLQL